MTDRDAIHSLNAIRHSGKIKQVTGIVESYLQETGGADPLESAKVLLCACDVLSSHDFGDYAQQVRLVHAYAERALLRSIEGCTEQRLRLLAHLQHDYEVDDTSSEEWRAKRLTRARRWLSSLEVLAENGWAPQDHVVQPMRPEPPVRELPHGVAEEHVSDPNLRNAYRVAIDRRHQQTEELTQRHRLKRLYRTYEPLAAKYIAQAYAREPFDLVELRQLLVRYPDLEMESKSSLGPPVEECHTARSDADARALAKTGPMLKSPEALETHTASAGLPKVVPRKGRTRPPRKRRT